MKMGLSDKEGAVLHDLLEHEAGDIVMRLNKNGFIEHSTDNLVRLGIDLSQSLFAPHIADLADGAYSAQLNRHVDAALLSEGHSGWVEFPVRAFQSQQDCLDEKPRRWFALSIRRLADEKGEAHGALGLMRSVDRVRKLENELFANTLTDPLTGLIKRQVLLARLNAQLVDRAGGVLALLAIDRMRALHLQYGQRTADEINWGFAKFLQSMALPESEVAQVEAERFAVMFPYASADAARKWTDDLLATFSSLALPSSGKTPKLTASVGIAPIEHSVDWTLRQAELSLIMARAGGGNRVAQAGGMTRSHDHVANAVSRPVQDWLGDHRQQR